MKKILLSCFLLSTLFVNSQERETKNESSFGAKDPSFFVNVIATYDNKFYQNDYSFPIKSMKDIGFNKLPIGSASLIYISNDITISRARYSNYHLGPGFMGFTYMAPIEVLIDDSLKQTFQGFRFSFSMFGQNLVKRKNLSFFLTEGLQIGRLKLIGDQDRRMKNMTIAPFIAAIGRVKVFKMSLFLLAQYDYDVSSTIWKKQWFHEGQKNHLDGFRQSGLTFSLGIGYNMY